MGNCHLLIDEYDPTNGEIYTALSSSQFYNEHVIGVGGFGRVWKVTFLCTGETFALKEMRKARIIVRQSVKAVLGERKLLAAVSHPFIVNMKYAFQDREKLYLVMDYMKGGDLRYHLGRLGHLTEPQAKFYAACILTGLEYLHLNKIIHRDLKPENLVLDDKGYLRITDFGAALVLGRDNSRDNSGTPGYMAPEVLSGKTHGVAVDYFALGVLLYESMLGRRLYSSSSRSELRDLMLSKPVQLRKTDVLNDWSMEAVDFVNKLLERKPQQRLGYNGPKEVKNHAWFAGFEWQKLLEKKLPAPLLPSEGDNFDAKYTQSWKEHSLDDSSEDLITPASLRSMFAGYFYDPRSKIPTSIIETSSTVSGQAKSM